MNRWTEDWIERAVVCFEDAIARDPGYALAHAALAECLVWFYSGIGTRPARETIPRAREAAGRALELEPGLAEGHKVTALIAMSHDWDRAAAERGFARAIELNPGSADVRVWNGWRLSLLEGSHEEALAELRIAEGLDPLDLKIKTQIGYVHYFLRDFESAAVQFRSVLAIDPHFAFGHYALGDVHAQQRRYPEAIEALQESIRLGGSSVNHLAILAHVHGLAGRTEEARSTPRGDPGARGFRACLTDLGRARPYRPGGERPRLRMARARLRGTRWVAHPRRGLSRVRPPPAGPAIPRAPGADGSRSSSARTPWTLVTE